MQTMAGKYLKSVRDKYCTNIIRYPGYERPGLVPKWELGVLIDDSKDNKMRKEGNLPPSAVEEPR